MANGPLWTPEDDARLAGMRKARVPLDDIVRRLGRTRAAVLQRCHMLGIKVGHKSHGFYQLRRVRFY
jgi:hypothetical protein